MKRLQLAASALTCTLVLALVTPLSASAAAAREPLSGPFTASSAPSSQTLSATDLKLGNVHFVQASEIVPVPTFEEGHVPTPTEIAVMAAERWLIVNGYLTDPGQLAGAGTQVVVSGSGITIVVTAPGLHIVIVLSNGPILPIPDFPDHRLLSATVFEQISNGI